MTTWPTARPRFRSARGRALRFFRPCRAPEPQSRAHVLDNERLLGIVLLSSRVLVCRLQWTWRRVGCRVSEPGWQWTGRKAGGQASERRIEDRPLARFIVRGKWAQGKVLAGKKVTELFPTLPYCPSSRSASAGTQFWQMARISRFLASMVETTRHCRAPRRSADGTVPYPVPPLIDRRPERQVPPRCCPSELAQPANGDDLEEHLRPCVQRPERFRG
jgi:hypothetical protein